MDKNINSGQWGFSPEIILRIVSLIHIFSSPFTKVEESFNLQAIHDLLYHQVDLEKYDHLEFPGVVPRTFIGPIIVATLSSPIAYIANLVFSKFSVQIVVRICLSDLVIRAFQKFRECISKEFGKPMGRWLVVITASQFHLMYYMGRTLPNIFAMPAVLMAFVFWMQGNHLKFILTAAFGAIVFRSELAMLFGIILLFELCNERVSLYKSIKYAIPSGIICIAMTVAIDSLFWRRLLWPEGEVFWFNTFLNQSHNWGTQPFLWYFYSAIPRALASSTFLVPLGLWINPRIRNLVIPCLIFVFFFSFLPHKELRFIFYVIPVLNVAAAAACDRLWKNRATTFISTLIAVGLIFHIVLNGVLSTGLLVVSRKNYPGGNALIKLQSVESLQSNLNVHIDVYSAQTGVSRFLELSKNWRYNKTEFLDASGPEMLEFSHLLAAIERKGSTSFYKTHERLLSIDGYAGLDINFHRFPPIKIKTEPKVHVLRRHRITDF